MSPPELRNRGAGSVATNTAGRSRSRSSTRPGWWPPSGGRCCPALTLSLPLTPGS